MANRTLAEAVKEYLEWRKTRVSHSTHNGDIYNLKALTGRYGTRVLDRLTEHDIDDYFYGPEGLFRQQKASTFNQSRAKVRRFFEWCQSRGYIKRNPASDVKRAKIPQRRRNRPPAELLLASIEKAVVPRDRMLMALLCNTGLRVSEIVSLKWGDIDLDELTLYATIIKTRDFDEMAITEDLESEIRRYLMWYQQQLNRPVNRNDFVLATYRSQFGPNGTTIKTFQPERHLRGANATLVIRACMESVGIELEPGDGAHTVRRALAYHYFHHIAQEMGDVAALRETADLLHHSQMATTEHYIGQTAEKARRDRRMRGKPFLTAMVGDRSNVTPLRDAQ